MLVEVIAVDPGLAGPRLQPCPAPRVPAERRVAHQVASRLGHGVGARRIDFEERVGELAVALPDAGDEFRRSLFPGEAQAFVGIVAHENRSVVVFAGGVEPVLVAANHPTVDDGPGGAAGPAGRKLVGGNLAEFRDRRDPGLLGVSHAGLLGVGQEPHVLAGISGDAGRAERSAALRDGAVEQALRLRRRAQHADGDAAGRFAEDRHLVRIAAEGRDVLLHPLQAGDQVLQAIVARNVMRRLGAQLRVRQETERSDAVGDADQDHAFPGQMLTVVDRGRGGAEGEPAAIDPDQHGHAVGGGLRGRPYVQIQAILAHARPGARPLDRIRGELGGRPHALPLRGGLRCAPAEVAHRRRGEWDAAVDGQILLGHALDEAVSGHDGRGGRQRVGAAQRRDDRTQAKQDEEMRAHSGS